MQKDSKVYLFEEMPIPGAVMKLCIPTVLSSLVMVLYNLADTFFVGMLNDPIQNAAVTLAYPVLLAFNAINNLFGVGTSSMMSRAMGRHDYDTVRRCSSVGFYMALICSAIFALSCTVFMKPLLGILGANGVTSQATADYMFWTVSLGAVPAILNVVLAYLVRAEGASLHASIGTMSGCVLNIILDPFFILPWGLNLGAAGAGMATCLANCFACLYFFVLLIVEKPLLKTLRRVPKVLRRLGTLFLVLISWTIFYFTDFGRLGQAFANLFGFSGVAFFNTATRIMLVNNIPLLLLCVLGSTPIPRILGDAFGLLCADKDPGSPKQKLYVAVTYAFCVGLLVLSTISLVGSGFSAFVYYRF